jgi:selenocysteine-specific elongation factor
MRVIATAGHVDHGKSTLVRALTGMEPDRWAEERRRGMTIDLGYAWTVLDPLRPDEQVAFVDVPGHQRFVTNMLAGVGPAPAVLLVIAADAGWARQTSEHLDAIEALGIRHGVVALTRSDLATPEQLSSATEDLQRRLEHTGLAGARLVAVSGVTGQGLPALRQALHDVLASLPEPRLEGRVRLWVDRCFTVAGAGTVVTGTLGAGQISIGDQLELRQRRYVVRGVQQLGGDVDTATAVARVAVNLRGLDRADATRGDYLLTPGAWHVTDVLDVVLDPLLVEPTGQLHLHIGSGSVPVRVRMLGDRAARLTLDRPLPVQVDDRAVLRDPGQQSIVAGVRVLDPDPPTLRRRGAAAQRGAELADGSASGLRAQVRRRGFVRADALRSLGVTVVGTAGVLDRAGWLVSDDVWAAWRTTLERVVDAHAVADPREPWLTEDAARRAVGLPDGGLLAALVGDTGLQQAGGRLGRANVRPGVGASAGALDTVLQRLEANPFDSPGRDELLQLGLGTRDLATAERNGMLLRLTPDLVVATDSVTLAAVLLGGLTQPFTVSQARQALGATRRVALPLLEILDRHGITVRHNAELRSVRRPPNPSKMPT